MADTNAFADSFLETLNKRYFFQYPVTLESGRWNGPWAVKGCETAEKWHVVRAGGSSIEAVSELWETACMVAAIYPISFESPVYGMDREPGNELQWALKKHLGERGYSTIGHLRYGREELLMPLHVAHSLLTSPTSLAWLLTAAPPEVLVQVGELMAKRMIREDE